MRRAREPPIARERTGGDVHGRAAALSSLAAAWRSASPRVRRRLALMFGMLAALNVGTWAALLVASLHYPLLLGLGLAAYGFGLRHAVDPDHIAAIDNATRKLMHDGKRPVAVGLWFSLGHSTIVIILSMAVALGAAYVKTHLPVLQSAGSIAGAAVSGVFLLIVGTINLGVLCDVVAASRRAAHAPAQHARARDAMPVNGGLLTRLMHPLLRLVRHSPMMYPIGVLFGLGFDTASEVALLGIAATTGAGGMPAGFILLLPLLFVAGMSLVDTADGVAMLAAYGWAFLEPARKLSYNVTITAISAIVALSVGGLEVLQVLGTQLHVGGGWRDAAARLAPPNLGIAIVAVLLLTWLISVAAYRLARGEHPARAVGAARPPNAS